MKDLKELTRPNIRALKPYSSARDEYSGAEASVFLDANENPSEQPLSRPDAARAEESDSSRQEGQTGEYLFGKRQR